MDVVRMIIDNIAESKDNVNPNIGSMGTKLCDIAKEVESKRKIVKEPEKKAELTVAELKVVALKKCEQDGDLCWMDYSSWNVFNPNFKKQFADLVDPLFWGGLYFQYSRFELHFPVLYKLLTMDCSISVLRDGANSQFVVTGIDDYMISKKKVQEFENYQRSFHSKIYKAFCRIDDQPIIRDYTGGVTCRK